MKAVGIAIIVLVSFLFGHERRSRQIAAERLSFGFSDFFDELKHHLSYGNEPLTVAVTAILDRKEFDRLSFLTVAVERLKSEDISLNSAFVEEAKRDATIKKLLTAEEYACLTELLSDFGLNSKERELEKLSLSSSLFRKYAEEKRAENVKKRGYYEVLYTLAGTTVAIILA